MFTRATISTLGIAVPAMAKDDHSNLKAFPARSAAGLILQQRKP